MKKSIITSIMLAMTTSTNANDIDDYHSGITDYINEKTAYLDEIIGDFDQKSQKTNKSYAIFNIKQNLNSLDENKTQVDFKIKADLPYTKKKWKIFLDTNPTDFNSLEEKSKETFTEERRIIQSKNSSVGGFIFSDLKNDWKKSYRAGVRFGFPLDPFVKANFYNNKKITDNINQHFEQEFFLYSEKGLGLKTNLDYYLRTDGLIYQSSSSTQYLANEKNELEIMQQFSRWSRLTDRTTLKYSVGVSAILNDEFRKNNYWVNARFRQKLYKDWLYLKVIPEVSFSKDYDYKPNYGLLLQIEMFFAKSKTLKKITRDY